MLELRKLGAISVLATLILLTGCRQDANVEQPTMQGMRVHYLEIVTNDVDAVCFAYSRTCGAEFGEPDSLLGNARTAELVDGSLVGVRAPMHADETPVVRPYWLVDDIKAAVAVVEKAGARIAVPPMEIPGRGTFAIYFLGDNQHGLWQQ